MKNLRLSDLRKKSNKYFKKIGTFSAKNKRRTSVEYIVSRTFEALPKYLKEALEKDKTQYIQSITNNIIVLGDENKIDPYKALISIGKFQSGRTSQAKNVFSRFRNETPEVYSKYNSYMYRLGFSASQYFYSKAEWNSRGSIITINLELPKKDTGVYYEYLTITLDMSNNNDLEAEMI